MAQSLKVVSAGVKQDFRAIAGALRIIITVDLIRDDVNPAFKKGLLFVCDLAEAKTADDVRKVFEDYAAPRGTYRAKYGGGKVLVTFNGYVGVFFAPRVPLIRATTGYKASDQSWIQPLAAPVGLDPDVPHPRSGQPHRPLLSAHRPAGATHHGQRRDHGAGLLRRAHARRLLPGGHPEVAIVFMAGARVQPLLKSPDTCGNARCWQAPLTGMVGFRGRRPGLPDQVLTGSPSSLGRGLGVVQLRSGERRCSIISIR